MDGQGQAPTAMPQLDETAANSTTLDTAAPAQAATPAPLASAVAPSTPAPPLTDLASTKSSDRPNGLNGPGDIPKAELVVVKEAPAVQQQPETASLTNGSALPEAAQVALPPALNADAVNAAGEAEHAARVEEQAKVESAILEADAVKKEENESTAARQHTPLTDVSLNQANAATVAGNADMLHSPYSPSSTSALSSVTASAAPSLANPTPSNQSIKDVKEDEESSESGHQHADVKPRSAGGRSAARRAASNASLRETATAASSTTSSSRRSEKPASASSASGANGSRTRGTSAQGQPQRQSSRSKASTTTSTSSNTRPRMRQRGASPDNKDGNDTLPGTRRSRRTRQSTAQNGRANGEEEDSDDGDEGVTRCVCGNNDDETLAFMIQCDTCKAWQHGPCVGFKYENDCPDTYYCEQCRPELHPNLLSRRSKKHGRSVSGSGRSQYGITAASQKDEAEELGRSTLSNKPTSRDTRELSTTSLPATATPTTSTGHPSFHRARASADAAMMSSFLDTSNRSPQPDSPGSTGGSSEGGGSKRPMYPPTSHFAAPQNPKRRSTMNSRDSAAFDESILLATQQAFRESRAMAMEGGSGSSKGRKRKKREDEDMEPVKEEEEDHSDKEDHLQSQSEKERSDTRANGAGDSSTMESSITAHEDEGEEDNDIDEQDEMSGDLNGPPAPRKRRRRRGAGALFTAPNKKRAASARAKKPNNADSEDLVLNGEVSVNTLQFDGSALATEDDANARKRKRDEANGDDDRFGRRASPAASHDTSASSQSSSDKPLAQGNKRLKASPALESGSNGVTMPSTQTVSNILGSTLQVAIPTASGEDSAAPSTAASVALGQTDAEDASKDAESHAKAVTNGLLAVTEAKRGVDTDQEESTPAPTAQADETANTSATTNGKGVKQPNQYTYKRGGPGSRGGLKGSPSKRAALAAAAEARHGKHRDDTPSTYEDWINQPPSWGLPDHLSHLSHLLPSQSPLPLQVAKFITSPNNSAAASPITPQGEAGSSTTLNGGSAPSTPAITVTSSLEPSAKIRFPSRRMSIAEMRKRAKNMLDYLARVQVDTIDRNNRNRALAAVQENILSNGHASEDETITPPPSMRFNKDTPLTPQATTLIDDLSRQLNSFQEKFL